MAITAKPVRKKQKEYAKKSSKIHGTSLKEGLKKAKSAGAGHLYNEMGHRVHKKTKRV